jgi:glycine/D-amino acid oxidase-like deaminating enzyme
MTRRSRLHPDGAEVGPDRHLREGQSERVWDDHCPWEAENELFDADYDRVMPWLEERLDRMPIFAELGIKRDVHGAISHPPDGNPLIGPAPGVRTTGAAAARRSASAGGRA